MVKGVARHAVIVRSPDLKSFEQAIFIMDGQSEGSAVSSADEMLSLACSLASAYSGTASRKTKLKNRFISPLACFLYGSSAVALIWWLVTSLPA